MLGFTGVQNPAVKSISSLPTHNKTITQHPSGAGVRNHWGEVKGQMTLSLTTGAKEGLSALAARNDIGTCSEVLEVLVRTALTYDLDLAAIRRVLLNRL